MIHCFTQHYGLCTDIDSKLFYHRLFKVCFSIISGLLIIASYVFLISLFCRKACFSSNIAIILPAPALIIISWYLLSSICIGNMLFVLCLTRLCCFACARGPMRRRFWGRGWYSKISLHWNNTTIFLVFLVRFTASLLKPAQFLIYWSKLYYNSFITLFLSVAACPSLLFCFSFLPNWPVAADHASSVEFWRAQWMLLYFWTGHSFMYSFARLEPD